jgi:hypothetical protein
MWWAYTRGGLYSGGLIVGGLRYAFLRYFFDSVIRDYALNFHAKWLSMLRFHSYVTYFIGILYFNIYGVEFYAGYNNTKIILGTE